MKLVMAVISNKDVSKVLDAITKEGFASTRISTTGQFLADGHTTLFIGTEDHQVEQLFDVLKKHVTKRVVRQAGVASTLEGSFVAPAGGRGGIRRCGVCDQCGRVPQIVKAVWNLSTFSGMKKSRRSCLHW